MQGKHPPPDHPRETPATEPPTRPPALPPSLPPTRPPALHPGLPVAGAVLGSDGDAAAGGSAKQRLRARLLAQRRASLALRHEPWSSADTAVLATRILQIPEITDARCVAAYVGLPGEPDLADLLARLLARGTRVLLPVVRADLDLDFREYAGTLIPGALGTREPPAAAPSGDLSAADAVIIPALAVDRAGRRLGRGGGSYDRALRRVAPDVPVIAVLYDQELLDLVPTEEHDRSVKIIVTPSRTLRCEPTDGTREHPRPSTS
ncbi:MULTISPECIES: 5-formyltetrahydrofolate cyclo-ligase [Frankia]|uniref:5-formyltetrahydrofolate cyclo-ligase n=1 Tax=Frankia alni (strain DSM 45986 / CECT 9034 / ACN14a) TaxID=326424 RepID=Q0RC09_FRAAA|nr:MULTISPECIES: 5-formyltetrahydrofolate cyclo-ligase [Frankia]CAJ65021.1 Putative ligase (partial match) [Frankia alni ACN14a]